MLPKIPVSITFYCTTLGHFKYQYCYKHSLSHLNEKLSLSSFNSLDAHIKISSGQDDVANEIKSDLKNFGFNVYTTEKDWNRKGNNHAAGYYADMLTLMSTTTVQQSPYVLLLEDDWLINCEKDLALYLSKGIELLKKCPEILCVRINDEINKDVTKSARVSNEIYLQNEDYSDFGATLTFQPTIMRARDWLAAVRFINKNWGQFKCSHCEIVSGHVMRYLFSDSSRPFAFFDPDQINATHIGSEEFAKAHG